MVGGTHKVYPDVIVARPCEAKNEYFEILYMLDLKMDVGYHRDIAVGRTPTQTYVAKAESLLEDLAMLKDSPELSTKSGNKKKSKTDRFAPRYFFSMHPQSSYDEVIITSKNAGNKTKEQELIERAKDPDCNIWVLSTGDHPNEYGHLDTTRHPVRTFVQGTVLFYQQNRNRTNGAGTRRKERMSNYEIHFCTGK